MIRYLFFAVLSAIGVLAVGEAATPSTTFYVQLVRGTNDDAPPQAGAKVIGSKLSNKLHPVFRWKNYWEINRVKVEVGDGKKARVRLSKMHEVELDLSKPSKRTVHFYRDGKQISTSTQPSGEALTIQGENLATENAWFIVVRRDKPSE